jgi:rhodanese-related sulfurtransferase
MLDVFCSGHGGPTIVSSRSVIGVDQHDGIITLHLRCWCGHLIVHRTGRNASVAEADAPASVSMVSAVPPARPSRAATHFALRLAYETDPADVWTDMQQGTARFVLVDARSRHAYEQAHIPGAMSIPHAELEAESARELLAERGADLFVTYCWRASCNAATKAAAKMAAFGLPVKEMLGGIDGWRAERLPVVTGPEEGSVPSGDLASCTLAS